MSLGKVTCLILGWSMLGVAQADTLQERLEKGFAEAVRSETGRTLRDPNVAESSLAKKEFESKKFEVKQFKDVKELGWQSKAFETKDFNPGRNSMDWANKEFKTSTNSDFSKDSRLFQTNRDFADRSSSLSEDKRFEAAKKAREDGVKAILEREKSIMSDMRYEGPEVKKIAQEMKLINETLKNKEDLKDHTITIKEIRDILNKN
ncbi:MAG: hypothetical protein HC904_13900 [Blastochloris sp.]|nr:hypothetical protein [Blastochloris sp.]